MINYNWGIGHTGLVVGEGEEALLYDHGMAGWAMCSDTVFTILKQSGGIFSSLEANSLMREDPWTLRHKLLELYFPSTRGFMTYTVK
ncbi:hypothetical protein JAG76_000943 [Providencia stuartii]|nr:hypothetical protein [Providencia sp. 21OH12SH02B-Prov]ELR5120328.1 hypothetical protein [Providencia stuartii]MTB42078.1 hypothetical protein [Providencia sp. wls1949]